MKPIEQTLSEIESRVNAATPGPWEAVGREVVDSGMGDYVADTESETDAALIAASRQDVPRLVKALRAALRIAPDAITYEGESDQLHCIREHKENIARILAGEEEA